MIKHIYACLCGVQREIEADKLQRGCAVQCHSCKEVRARVESLGQGMCWITVDPKQVDFYDILGIRSGDAEEVA